MAVFISESKSITCIVQMELKGLGLNYRAL